MSFFFLIAKMERNVKRSRADKAEQDVNQSRLDQVDETWGALENQPVEVINNMLLQLPLSDLIVMQQVSKSAFYVIRGFKRNLIDEWFKKYLGSDMWMRSWILQKLIGNVAFSLEHMSENAHVYVSDLTKPSITLRIEDTKKEMLYKQMIQVAPIIMGRQVSKRVWIVSLGNNRAGRAVLYNFLYRIMTIEDMIPDMDYITDREVEVWEQFSRVDQLKATNFDLFFESSVDLINPHWLLEWERFHLGETDLLRHIIMYYTAMETDFFRLVDQNGEQHVFMFRHSDYASGTPCFFVEATVYFAQSLRKRIQIVGEPDESKPGWVTMLVPIEQPVIWIVPFIYDCMTEGKLRLVDFEAKQRVLK
ncbi:MAG: hypothetical protein K2Q45_03935 [Nitrosomonas sp.]|nr:hypothetical protein [Nitrosomonas sp.]